MPGDLEGSPALTFAPIPLGEGDAIGAGSLAAMMERRYEAYKAHVVRPFFRDHFARLDRQIVLVDALSALNSGPAAMRDLETALADVMRAFRAGRSSRLASIFRPRVDRILFAATKADHLHHTSHDRLEAILRALTARAIARAEGRRRRDRRHRARRDPRHPRGPDHRRAAKRWTRSSACRKRERRSADRSLTASPKPRCSRANCRPTRMRSFAGDAIALPEADNDWRFVRFRPPSHSRAAARRRRSGSTARCNS